VSLGTAREALLADARGRAQEVVAQAEAQAHEQIELAARQAEELVAAARARGEADGHVESAREEAAQRFAARAIVLAAERESYEELRRRARAAALALREDQGYPRLLERLAAAARGDLGEGAALQIDPPELGGVLATAGTRAVDYSLVALADRCVDHLGPRLEALWR
jgi:flagellar hook-length control protein FliK